MKTTLICLVSVFYCLFAFSAQKGKILSQDVQVYTDADFDSEVIETVQKGESYLISDKVFGPFFRIKLKSGKIGYVPDNEVYIEGKGYAVPGAAETSDDPFLEAMDDVSATKKEKLKKTEKNKKADDEIEDEDHYQGVTLQIVNFHEDTMGAVQVDDLPAIGYRYMSDLSWEIFASFKTPSYYTDKIKGSASKGLNIWSDFTVQNLIPFSDRFIARYGAGPFVHVSSVQIHADTANGEKSYDMQDVTVGLLIEGALFITYPRFKSDITMKYFFDRQSYGALGFAFYF